MHARHNIWRIACVHQATAARRSKYMSGNTEWDGHRTDEGLFSVMSVYFEKEYFVVANLSFIRSGSAFILRCHRFKAIVWIMDCSLTYPQVSGD